MQSINRRTFLAGSAATATSLMAPQFVRAQNKHKVLVIGAGLSGLNTALTLQSAGVDVQVIEGSQRIGGRVLSNRNIPGAPEFGGTSMGAGYARIVDAARNHGVPLIDFSPIIPYFRQREIAIGGEIITLDKWPEHPSNPFPAPLKQIPPWAFLFVLMGNESPLKSADDWISPELAHLDISVHEWMSQKGASW